MRYTHIQQKIHVASLTLGKHIFYTSIAFSLLAGLIYMYFIASITSNIVARKAYEQDQKAVQSEISALELAYLTKIRNLDASQAETLGLGKPREVYFASKDTRVGTIVGQ